MPVVPHPPYSPDLAPCDFFLFPKMKLKLKERRFKTLQEIETESQRVLHMLQQKDFQGTFEAWQKRWGHCIKSQGDYFEGNGGKLYIM
ncbi:mariner mos1 transposase [Lasius niger]|uniref:Mariner mos1 transposase n=1 Tax=Lasius niger TaxID=67767 RepID=A0A0J7JXG7_LASNI|nr:mariner mos1 transposase [Lasius niger]